MHLYKPVGLQTFGQRRTRRRYSKASKSGPCILLPVSRKSAGGWQMASESLQVDGRKVANKYIYAQQLALQSHAK